MTPRTDHGDGLYEGAFGDIIGDARIIADIGAGDSSFAYEAGYQGKRVLSIDPLYKIHPPRYGGWYVAADARDMPEVPSDSVDVAVSVLTMQHVEHGSGDAARIVREMARITMRANKVSDPHGFIAFFPVWQPERLQDELRAQYGDVAAIGFPGGRGALDIDRLSAGRLERKNMQTLVIRKTDALTSTRLEGLADIIEASRALTKRRKTIGDRWRGAVISTTGENRMIVRGRKSL